LQGVWLDQLEREYDNLRVDLDWCLGDPDPEVARVGLRLGSGLWFFWTVRGHIKEGRERLAELLELPGAQAQTTARARALLAAGWLAWFNSDGAGALGPLEEALRLHQELGNEPGAARALAVLGLNLVVYTEDLAAVRASSRKPWFLVARLAIRGDWVTQRMALATWRPGSTTPRGRVSGSSNR
jgi:hypothetical protein